VRDRCSCKCEVDHCVHAAQRMIGVYAMVEINAITEQVLLPFVLSHHDA